MMNQHQINIPPLSATNTALIALLSGSFLLTSFVPSIVGYLALSPIMFKQGFVWNIFTYPLVNVGFMNLFFNALLIWFIGGEIEQTWGQKRYFKFLGISVVSVGVIFLLLSFMTGYSMHLYSMNGLMMGLLVVYGMIFPERVLSLMLIFPIKAKYFCWVLVAIQMYMTLLQGVELNTFSHLFFVLVALVFIFLEKRSFYKAQLQKKFNQKQRDHLKSQLKLIKNEDDDNPKFWN